VETPVHSADDASAPGRGAPLSRLPRTLAGRFGGIESAQPDRARKNAAVAVVLRPPQGMADPAALQCDFLAIRRAESARDPWSGQMALPGGRLDRADAGLAATAIRETGEETGVDLTAPEALLGRIEALRPVAVRIPPLTIWPFVFQVDAGTDARVASHEVATVHWFPLRAMQAPANRGTHTWSYGGVVRRFPCVRIDGQVVWGLTYRVLTRFLQVVSGEVEA